MCFKMPAAKYLGPGKLLTYKHGRGSLGSDTSLR